MSDVSKAVDPHRPRRGLVVDGRYELEEIIGEGGMATVWSARHLKLNQSVAVKFLKKTAEPLKQRFLREARVSAAIKHRHVVQVMDFGVSGDWAYLVMEKLIGMTLAERLMDGSIPAVEAVRVTAQLLGGLSAVHDAKMAHRDLKPENIFLVEDADGTYPKIVDFGLSKKVGTSRDDDLRSVIPTAENLITGTPEYMSPEQARGLADVDERTDTWSIAVLLFEMLTGEFPFTAEAVGDLLVKIMTEDAPKLSEHRPDLGPRLEQFISFGLMRDRDKRYPNARVMRQALLVAVNQTASDLHAEGHRGAAKNMLRAVSSAYEPGDSGMVFAPKFSFDFDDVSEVTGPFLDPIRTARQIRDAEGRPLHSKDMVTASVFPHSGIETIEADFSEDDGDRQRRALVAGIVVLLAVVIGLGALILFREPAGHAESVPEAEPRTTAASLGDPSASSEVTSVEATPSEPEVTEPLESAEADQDIVEPAHADGADGMVVVRVAIPTGATLYVNGRAQDPSRVDLPRNGQRHLFVVRKPGRRAWSRNIVAQPAGTCADAPNCVDAETHLEVDRLPPARRRASMRSGAMTRMGLFESAGF